METLTTVLLFAIGVFLIGNILLLVLEKRQQKAVKRLPLGSASQEIINSKVDVLNKRVSRLEQKERKKEKPKTVKAIVKKEKKKTTKYPITKYKRKKKV